MADMMKQAQQLQNKLARVQEEAGQKTVEASAGGNMVNAVVNGRLELISLRIDPTVVEGGDVEMLQDLVLAAVNEGVAKPKNDGRRDEQNHRGAEDPGLTP
jgi:DNA-binding YbaB/EbfC family protein